MIVVDEHPAVSASDLTPGPIKKLSDRFLSNPKTIEVARPATANASIDQRVLKVDSRKKKQVLTDRIAANDVRTAMYSIAPSSVSNTAATTALCAAASSGECKRTSLPAFTARTAASAGE